MSLKPVFYLLALVALPAAASAESRFLSNKVVSHLQTATEACAAYMIEGQDISALEDSGFDRERRDWVWDTYMHGVEDDRLSVTVTTESDRCKVDLSRATRNDYKWLRATMVEAFGRRGFTETEGGANRHYLVLGEQRFRLAGALHRHTEETSASVTVTN